MRTGRPTPPVVLSAEERQTLEQWARRPTTAQALAQRARLVLACASTRTNGDIAAAAGVTRQTVGRWRHRFVRKRLQGLLDEPRQLLRRYPSYRAGKPSRFITSTSRSLSGSAFASAARTLASRPTK